MASNMSQVTQFCIPCTTRTVCLCSSSPVPSLSPSPQTLPLHPDFKKLSDFSLLFSFVLCFKPYKPAKSLIPLFPTNIKLKHILLRRPSFVCLLTSDACMLHCLVFAHAWVKSCALKGPCLPLKKFMGAGPSSLDTSFGFQSSDLSFLYQRFRNLKNLQFCLNTL